MFTDGPVTPLHVETLVEVLRRLGTRKFDRDALYGTLQPNGVAPGKQQSKDTIRASIELALVQEAGGSEIELTVAAKGRTSIRDCVLDAIDSRVLKSTEVEFYFALFYSYMIAQDKAAEKRNRDDWVAAFNRDVFDDEKQSNPFNVDKLSGLHRWFEYAGLGWYDPSDEFQCSPYLRVRRRLPEVFNDNKKLDGDTFMERIATVFPELDGGELFLRANRTWDSGARKCTLGLSHALINLHLDEVLRLHCSRDSSGWSIRDASPPNDGKTLLSDRLDFVEVRKGAKQ